MEFGIKLPVFAKELPLDSEAKSDYIERSNEGFMYHLFLRIFDLYDNVDHDSIILIDEPETHLHPKWIKGYVKILNELLGKKGVM